MSKPGTKVHRDEQVSTGIVINEADDAEADFGRTDGEPWYYWMLAGIAYIAIAIVAVVGLFVAIVSAVALSGGNRDLFQAIAAAPFLLVAFVVSLALLVFIDLARNIRHRD